MGQKMLPAFITFLDQLTLVSNSTPRKRKENCGLTFKVLVLISYQREWKKNSQPLEVDNIHPKGFVSINNSMRNLNEEKGGPNAWALQEPDLA